MTFKSAVQNTPVFTRTENNMKSLESSCNPLVDLFFKIGASRGKNIVPLFEAAYQWDRKLALRMACWARDVRGGAGERQIFRDILRHVEVNHPKEIPQLLEVTPIYGRWDDLLVVNTREASDVAGKLISEALREGNGLCAKWMPRKGPEAVALRNYLGMSPKQYRKTLVNLTNVVEQAMCSGNWNEINYEHVPSVAAARYQKAFGKHDPVGYGVYRIAVAAGEAKVNANAVYPYDVIKSLRMGGANEVVIGQWNALPNYVGDANVLPMVDVSGSMTCAVGGNANLSCMDVAVSLGLYLADKNHGAFKDLFLTFSERSQIQILRGNIVEKFQQMARSKWGMNTNLHSAFEEVLRVATSNAVPAEDMPAYILILSDMQFDQCTQYDDTAMEMIRRKYSDAGYEVPNIIFWQLNAREGSIPVKYNEKGAALVSGFSPSIMTSILKAEEIDPVSVMMTTLNSPRYEVVQ